MLSETAFKRDIDDPKTILKKCKRIVTDSLGVDEPKDPDSSQLFALFRLFAGAVSLAVLAFPLVPSSAQQQVPPAPAQPEA